MKFAPVNFETIAAKAGVSKMTVSRALRGETNVSPATRERIRKIATQAGYQPNPLLAIYQSQVRASRAPSYQATIAWVNDKADREYWRRTPYNKGLLLGARAQAESLGYRLDEIWLEEMDETDAAKNIQRFARVLHARGIHGCILPLGNPAHAYADWKDFSVAVIGMVHDAAARANSPVMPDAAEHHKASFDYFANVRIACEKLRSLGYRRIGFLLCSWLDIHTDKLYRGSFLAQQMDWPRTEHIPICTADSPNKTPPAGLEKWLDKHRPDAVLCSKADTKDWLIKLGRQIPDDLGLAHLYLAEDVKDWSGINPGLAEVGAAAVDLVVQQLKLNQRGVPARFHELFVTGKWSSGNTTRKL